mmetsp:Transcript_36754/g.64710  ORF Transcript_36754/g.64710 Transcript_36754/m.64710 type:complete len:126 (+) Transcript_36754:101-478(+)
MGNATFETRLPVLNLLAGAPARDLPSELARPRLRLRGRPLLLGRLRLLSDCTGVPSFAGGGALCAEAAMSCRGERTWRGASPEFMAGPADYLAAIRRSLMAPLPQGSDSPRDCIGGGKKVPMHPH